LIPAPATLGEEAVGVRGLGAAEGGLGLAWRRGRLIFSIYERARPGEATFERILALARALDARAAQRPLP
jgi:hypothetical protein